MTSFKPAERLKTRMLSDALERNLDVIHDRLPPSRRKRRRLRRLAPIAIAAILVVTSAAALTHKPAAPPALAASPVRAASAPVAARAAAPPAVLDASVLATPVQPGLLELAVRRVVIDAGHGGVNPGTSSASGLKEKDLTLDIAERVSALLGTRGFDVVMTRTSDETLSLQQRAAAANGRRGDIFVSIHLNWLQTPRVRGIETYYLGPSRGSDVDDAIVARENQESGYSLADMRALLERIYTDARRDESRKLATLVQQSLVGSLQKREPAIADRGVKMAPFVVLGATEMPAILAEVSCLSNREQAEELKAPDARQRIAEALVSGIQSFARESRVTVAERTGSHGS